MKFSLKIFSRHFGSSSLKQRAYITNPQRDWNIMLAAFFLVLLGLFLWSGFLFLKISSGDLFTAMISEKVPVDMFDRERLHEALLFYENQDSVYKQLHEEVPEVGNPLR